MRLKIGWLAPLAVAACALLLLPAAAAAKANKKKSKKSAAAAVAYLEGQQTGNGGFATDWVINSLAADGVAAANVKSPSSSTDARSWYVSEVGNPSWPVGKIDPSVTEFERATLNAYAAGIDPARVSPGQNLIARIAAQYQPANPGYYGTPTNFNGTIFALLALAEAKTTSNKVRVPRALLDQSVTVVEDNQHSDGGWTFERAEGEPEALAAPAEPDESGAALAALCSAGVPTTNATVRAGISYLEADLTSSGAFEAEFGVNTDSNAWAIQGLDACGIDPQGAEFTSGAGHTPVEFLISDQLADGGFVFSPEETEANEYSTQDALRALAGAGFTAAPPKPTGGAPRFLAERSFHVGTPSPLALIIDNGTATLEVCSVTFSPTAASATLGQVLEAAKASSTPSGCVTGFSPATGKGALTQLNGSPAPPEARWDISIDGSKEKEAKLASKIEIGDTISLQLH